jgi:hypothetical protein
MGSAGAYVGSDGGGGGQGGVAGAAVVVAGAGCALARAAFPGPAIAAKRSSAGCLGAKCLFLLHLRTPPGDGAARAQLQRAAPTVHSAGSTLGLARTARAAQTDRFPTPCTGLSHTLEPAWATLLRRARLLALPPNSPASFLC